MKSLAMRQYAADPLGFIKQLKIETAHGPQPWGEVAAEFQCDRMAELAPALVAVSRGQKPEVGRQFWEATKGCSKDTDLALALLWLLCFARRPLLCQVGAADQDQAAEMKKAADSILYINPWLAEFIAIQAWKIVAEKNKAAVEIIAADTAGSHGARPDVLIINELSHITRREFAENLRDNAAKVGNGLVVVATNAGFQNTWQFDWREIARTSERWYFHQWSRPSPWIDSAEIEESQRRNPIARHLRLFYGVWATGSGDALDHATIDSRVILSGPAEAKRENCVTVAGLDLGVKRDHSAFVVLECDGSSGHVRLLDCRAWAPVGGQVALDDVQDYVICAQQIYGLRSTYFDPHQCLLMSQQLEQAGVSTKEMGFVGQNLNRMASAMLEAFRSARIDLYDDPALLDDLKRLNIVERSFGIKLEAPADTTCGHCDRAFALAICLPAALELASRDTSEGDNIMDHLMAGRHDRPRGPFGYVLSRRHSLWF